MIEYDISYSVFAISPAVVPLVTAGIGAAASMFSSSFSSSKQNSLARKQIESNEKIAEANRLSQEKIAEQNLSFQKDAYDYQRFLNDKTMSREDSAVQRRVADLKAAGINPVLAAGDSASSASFRAGQAPQYDGSYLTEYAEAKMRAGQMAFENKMAMERLKLDMVSQMVDISRTAAESEVLRERAADMREKRPLNVENMQLANSFLNQTLNTRVQRELAGLDYDQKRNILVKLQSRLTERQIDYEEVRYLLGWTDYQLRNKNLDKIDKEILVLDSLLKSRALEQEERRWNLDYFKERGLPTSYRDPVQVKLFNEVLRNADKMFTNPADVNLPGLKPFNLFEATPESHPQLYDDDLLRLIEIEEENYRNRKKKNPTRSF